MARLVRQTETPHYSGGAAAEKRLVSIGQAELIEHYSLLIPKGEPVHIPVRLGQFAFGMDVEFDDEQEEASVNVIPIGTGVKITFLKWDSALGTALDKPVTLADLPDGRKLLMMATNYAIGRTKKLDLQLLLQGTSRDGE